MRSRFNKYHAKKSEADGITFDSRKEMLRYLELKALLERGEISDLRRQVPFELLPPIYREEIVHLKTKDKTVSRCIQRAVKYTADFVYLRDGREIIEDSKGMRTKEYVLKKKMMLSLLGKEIVEV